tara:strand:- start:131 stop:973 length:843 start_codon:yes stop_codon:yes gene_type:complete
MIIWLASYPKSGNTWMRSIISALLYSVDGNFNFNLLRKIDQFPEKKYFKYFVKNYDDFNEIKKNWIVAQDKINLDGKIKLFKTHQGKYTIEGNSFTNNDNTLATIYIVRDPRNLVQSISNHYTKSLEDSCEFLLAPKIIGNGKNYEDKQGGLYTLLGKWNEHYRSWTTNKNNLLLIKYEDLIKNPKAQLEKTIDFLKKYLTFETDEKKINNILETTSFDNLKKLEKEGQFNENPQNKKDGGKVNFFHLGPKNLWHKNLNEKIVSKIEKNFFNEMKELGYL